VSDEPSNTTPEPAEAGDTPQTPDAGDAAAPTPAETAEATEPTTESVPAFDTSGFDSRAVNGYVWGTGRRKTSVARVRIRPGEGKFEVNKRSVDEFFCIDRDREYIRAPLTTTKTEKEVDVFVRVNGGGTTGQAGAIRLGLARALKHLNPSFEQALRESQLLTRDSRKVERKKYGQRGARRRFQFSKR